MNLEETLKDIATELAALPDLRDVPNTPRAQEEVAAKRRRLEARAQTLRVAAEDVRRLDPKIADLEKWHTVLKSSHEAFSQELKLYPDPARSRRAQDLQLAIKNIEQGCETFDQMTMMAIPLGEALRMAGYSAPPNERSVWSAGFGNISNTERQLETLRKRRAAAQAVLDQELGVTTAEEPVEEELSITT